MALNVSAGLDAAADLWRNGRFAEAEKIVRGILAVTPEAAAPWHLLALIAVRTRRPRSAQEAFEKSLALERDPVTVRNYADALLQQNELAPAEKLCAELEASAPDHPRTLSLKALICQMKGDLEGAMRLAQATVEKDPRNISGHATLSRVHRLLVHPDESIAEARTALVLGSSDDTRLILAEMLLIKGDFAAGWPEYGARWENINAKTKRHQHLPAWTGQPLSGVRLLVWAEQGAGDTLQFFRYVEVLASRGATVILECQPQLKGLLMRNPAVHAVRGLGEPLPPTDTQVPLLDLPRYLGTTLETIPAKIPYIFAEPRAVARWWDRLKGPELKVGLVWAGDPKHPRDKERSIPLAMLSPLAGVVGVKFYSLQLGHAAEQSAPKGLKVQHLSPRIAAWEDTAAVVSALDLVITVDTSVAHLAGGLGRPVWTLVTYFPDWRWLLGREGSPWYPTMRLFRQAKAGEWRPVIDAVAASLRDLAAGQRRPDRMAGQRPQTRLE